MKSTARLGLKVALVQGRPVLGGVNSSEVRVHLGGHNDGTCGHRVLQLPHVSNNQTNNL